MLAIARDACAAKMQGAIMLARMLVAVVFAGLATGTAVAQSSRPGDKPQDDRAALQKSMNDFKRNVTGKLAEEGGRRETGVGQFLSRPSLSGLQIRGSISVPDGGETLLGGVSNSGEGKNSAGLGPLQNRSAGKSTSKTTASARVWIIIFSEEEERQTGYSPKK
jgi:hypothetical protein